MAKQKILIIEDDADLREGLCFSFASDGYDVAEASTAGDGLRQILNENCSLVLLDCNLPDGSGFDLCKEVRRFSRLPVIMLTARDSELDEIKALELGADDYLSKPFSLGVLKARIRRALDKSITPEILVSGNITLDKSTCRVFKKLSGCKGHALAAVSFPPRGGFTELEITVSPLEFRLLSYLMENRNHVLSKEQILSRIWDSDGKYVDHNTVSVNISRLRAKIEDDPSHPVKIRTVHGVGYIWKE